jgi:hypothetical protein
MKRKNMWVSIFIISIISIIISTSVSFGLSFKGEVKQSFYSYAIPVLSITPFCFFIINGMENLTQWSMEINGTILSITLATIIACITQSPYALYGCTVLGTIVCILIVILIITDNDIIELTKQERYLNMFFITSTIPALIYGSLTIKNT